MRALYPVAGWSTTDHLLALVFDAVSAGNWQRAGGKGTRPKPLTRPGTEDRTKSRYGTAVPVDEMRDLLDHWGEGADDGS